MIADRRTCITKWITCWICLSLFLIFISNIFMHLLSCRSGNTDKNVFTLQEYQNCEITKAGQYIQTDSSSMQLIYSVDDPAREMSKICIDFGKPLGTYLWLELYYPDEQGKYPPESARKEQLLPGMAEHVIDVEPGNYREIRIDFDCSGSIDIKDVYAGEPEKMMLYADHVWRHRIWGICFLLSFFLSVLLFVCQKSKMLWEKLCQNVQSFVLGIYSSINLRKVLKVCLGGMIVGGCLEGVTMLLSTGRFNEKEALVFSAGGMIVFSFFVFRDAYIKKMERTFLMVFLLLGSVFICVIPVSTSISWDDETHYYRLVSMARAFTGTITEADDLFIANCEEAAVDTELYQREYQNRNEHIYNEKCQNGAVLDNGYVFSYKDIAYLPFVMGIWTAYGLGLSFCATALLAKFFQLLFMGMLVYASMRNLKSGKMLIPVFAMVPTVFFLTVSYSYDSWLTFLMIYAFSRYFGEVQRKDEKLTFIGFCRIFVPAFLALLPKIVYAPMLFLMEYMPKSKWKEKKWRIAWYACFICAALLVLLMIQYVASGQMKVGSGDSRTGAKVNGDLQLQYIIQHFGVYCHTLFAFLRTYFSYDLSAEYLTYMSGMGILHMQYITITLLFVTALWDQSSLDHKTIPVLSKVAALIMPGIIAAICATVMYLVFTGVGMDRIHGCHGRYILPIIFPSLFMVSRYGFHNGIHKKIPIEVGDKRIQIEISAEIGNMILIFFNVWFLLYNIWVNCVSKY